MVETGVTKWFVCFKYDRYSKFDIVLFQNHLSGSLVHLFHSLPAVRNVEVPLFSSKYVINYQISRNNSRDSVITTGCVVQNSAAQSDLVVADGSDPLCYPNVLARSKAANGTELPSGRYANNVNLFKHLPVPVKSKKKCMDLENSTDEAGENQYRESFVNRGDSRNVEVDTGGYVPALWRKSFVKAEQIKVPNTKFFYPACYEGNGRQVGKSKECGGSNAA